MKCAKSIILKIIIMFLINDYNSYKVQKKENLIIILINVLIILKIF